jgi:O-antigen ligase
VSTVPARPASRREGLLLAAIAAAPAVIYFLFKQLGYFKYLKLAGLGVLALAGATAVLVRPRVGLWVVLFYVYAGLSFYVDLNVGGLLSVLLMAAVTLELVLGDQNRVNDALFWYAAAAFLLIAVGSMLWARDTGLALFEISNYLKMVVLTYLVVQLVRTPQHLRLMMYVIFAGGVATVLLGVANLLLGIQSVADNYIRGSTYMLRFMGTHGNPNRAAAFICTTIPMGIFALRHGRRAWKPFVAAGIVLLVVAVFATFSRSVVFPLVFIALAVMAREMRGKRAYLGVAVVVAVGAVLTPREYWERVLGLREAFQTTTLDWSVYTRLLALRTAWDMFLDHPFTGIGIGNFLVAASYQLFVRIVVHNTYLEVLVGTGIFGLLAFLAILYAGFRHSVAGAFTHWKHHPAWLRSASFYCALSGISIWMSAFFGTMPFRHPFWVPVAAGLVIGNLLRDERRAD